MYGPENNNVFWKSILEIMSSRTKRCEKLFSFSSLLKMSCKSLSKLASLSLFEIITELSIAEDTQTQSGGTVYDCEALNATVMPSLLCHR